MSSPTWTPAALSSEARPYRGAGWRLVEAQHRVSTLGIVDSLAEQAVLEDILEATKPVLPPECAGLDYLLATPFRYDALYPHGSRFRRAGRTLGVFYAAGTPRTAVAELAFYRLLFFAESPGTPFPASLGDYTAFAVRFDVRAMLDLTAAPLDCDAAHWRDPIDYSACQALADAARQAGVQIIRYGSVRDPEDGCCLAVLDARGFAEPRPFARRTWRLRLSSFGVQAISDHPDERLEFPLAAFGADPRLASLRL